MVWQISSCCKVFEAEHLKSYQYCVLNPPLFLHESILPCFPYFIFASTLSSTFLTKKYPSNLGLVFLLLNQAGRIIKGPLILRLWSWHLVALTVMHLTMLSLGGPKVFKGYLASIAFPTLWSLCPRVAQSGGILFFCKEEWKQISLSHMIVCVATLKQFSWSRTLVFRRWATAFN